MSLLARIKSFLEQLFCKRFPFRKKSNESNESCLQEVDVNIEPCQKDYEMSTEENIEQFKVKNVVFEKLNYLEQYIKIFSLPFPERYSHYLNVIQAHRKEYEAELKEYSEGLLGDLTFAIDPECESDRLIAVASLEEEITDFVELVFNFSVYKEKFSKLCLKLNQFYNALLDTTKEVSVIVAQLDNAIKSMHNLVAQVNVLRFFKTDSRKKEIILNYIIYGEYIFFKSYLRCQLTTEFDDYKENFSKFHNLFVDDEYNNLIFKFFIEDLEQYQLYITANLAQDKMYNLILKSCQNLQTRLNSYETVFHDSSFFTELIKFENTVDNISKNCGIEFTIPLPNVLVASTSSENRTSVKDIATSVLDMLNYDKAKILRRVISNFKADISWREFYFLCKIFELYKDVINASYNTIFSSVSTKFAKLDTRYCQYSDTFIQAEKEKLLNYHGSKSKKYVFLLKSETKYLPTITYELQQLRLDFLVSGDVVYINHSYFNGFKNLEQNFGQYKLLEELL